MAFLLESSSIFGHVLFCLALMISSCKGQNIPNVPHLTNSFSHLSIHQSFNTLFGLSNIKILNNGPVANIALDKYTGSGLISKNKYHYGFFSAAIKLPSGFSSGVVVAFYLSNANEYRGYHDELDIELLGHSNKDEWILQTNVYANGRVSSGREEKIRFWFNPTQDYHTYSILWNSHHVIFLVDNIPMREIPNKGAFSSFYPSKPMSLYVTIWDGSTWADGGGKHPINYTNAPFVSSISQAEIYGCTINTRIRGKPCSNIGGSLSKLDPVDGKEFVMLSKQEYDAMNWARTKFMIYSYCKDLPRYKVMPPECK